MFKRILTISAHADDTALCAGGLLARCKQEGVATFDITFSQHKGVPSNYYPDKIVKEHAAALDILGTEENYLYDIGACNGEFVSKSGWIMFILENLREDIQPDLVITHPGFDTNQDHVALNREVIRTFKSFCSIMTYDFPSNCMGAGNSMAYFSINEEAIKSKIEAILQYDSQVDDKYHYYMDEDTVSSLATVRGMQIKEDFAEAFYVERGIF